MREEELLRIALPPGRHRLPREFIRNHQRVRLFAAIVQLVDEQGYPSTSLTQIVRTAGIARHTFTEHFADKEALFLAVFDAAAEGALRVSREAAEAVDGPWEDRFRASVRALLAEIAERPALTRVALTETMTVSDTSRIHFEAALKEFSAFLRRGREVSKAGEELPASLEEVLVGGVNWMLARRLSNDPAAVEELLPEIMEFVLTPYIGKDAAQEAARQPD